MSSSETLATFLAFDEQARRKAAALEKSRALSQSKDFAAALRGPAADAILASARLLLDGPLVDVIGDAWSKLDQLLRFRDPGAFPPDQVNDFVLHAHEIALKRAPSVEIVLNGAPTGVHVPMELKIGLTIESAVLKIQNARIVGAEIGKVRGGGAFSCVEVTVAERKTAAVNLPGRLTFAPGVAIG